MGLAAAVVVGVVLAGGEELCPEGPRGGGSQLRVETTEDSDDGGGRPALGAWRGLPEAPIAGRFGHVAVWTGADVFIWGGRGCDGQVFDDGAAYRPATDEWRELPAAPAGQTTESPVGVWTGQEVVVLGGDQPMVYAPEQSLVVAAEEKGWRLAASPPEGEWAWSSAGWTGQEVAVLARGQRRAVGYDPRADRWRELADPPVAGHAQAVSAEVDGGLVVLGRRDPAPAVAFYEPGEDRWANAEAVPDWPGSDGGQAWAAQPAVNPRGQRAVFAGPLADSGPQLAYTWSPQRGWGEFALPETLEGRRTRLAWAGTGWLAWAGQAPDQTKVQPPYSSNLWRGVAEAPLRRRRHAGMVWTGEEFVVWGGRGDGQARSDGAALAFEHAPEALAGIRRGQPTTDPDLDGVWQRLPDPPLDFSRPRPGNPVAVWSGNELVLLDARDPSELAVYEPSAVAWRQAPPLPDAAEGAYHDAVWAGDELVVVGGLSGPGVMTAWAYEPDRDEWQDLAPPPETVGGTVRLAWTGQEVVAVVGAGGEPDSLAYHPDRGWRELTLPAGQGAPAGMVWTGTEVVAVWNDGVTTRWHPDEESWRRAAAAPFDVLSGTLAWDGHEVLGASTGADGAVAYDPDTDSWHVLPTWPAPHAIPTGSADYPLVLGGPQEPHLYESEADTWRSLPPLQPGADTPRTAVWTDHGLVAITNDAAYHLTLHNTAPPD